MATGYQLGPENGRVLLETGRAGLAARAGHDLTLEVTRWTAWIAVPAEEITEASVTAELDLGSLEVREGTGGVMPLTDSDRREIKKTMTGILGQATAEFASTGITRSGDGGEIAGTLTLRGQARPVRLRVTEPEPGRYRGTATVRQTDFGIKPYRGFLGALKLADEVAVDFDLTLPGPPPAP
jgi:polyisoprenoid-binding protein YceI